MNAFAVLLLLPVLAGAAVTELPSVLGNGMVLQRERSVPVWAGSRRATGP